MFAIQYKNTNQYLYLQYVDFANKRSSIVLTDSNFGIFSTNEAAIQYIEDGEELFYNYEDCNIDKKDFNIVEFGKISK